jgi:hypothetical protein
LEIDEGEYSASPPGHLIVVRELQCPLNGILGVPLSRSARFGEEIPVLILRGIEPRKDFAINSEL